MPSLISQKCYYALKALFDLAQRESEEPVKIGAVADRQMIPIRFLEAIFRQLKQAGFVDSRRGAEGGYYLLKNPSEITLIEVINFFEGDFARFGAVGRRKNAARGDIDDVLALVHKESLSALSGVLSKWTIADLVKKAGAGGGFVINFTI